jgi:tetratricopeptide (TPR) repeat protein
VPPPPIASLSPEAKQALVAFDRGLELVHHKDHQRALEAWREAVALDPSNRTYQANLKRLERLIASNPG